MSANREGGLLAWQLREYPTTHRSRHNLLIHLLTAPLFVAGTVALVAAPFAGPWLLALAVPAILLPVALQGRGHAAESCAPSPFLGRGDFVARIFLEQWITFPRFVLGGGFADRWRAASPPERAEAGAGRR